MARELDADRHCHYAESAVLGIRAGVGSKADSPIRSSAISRARLQYRAPVAIWRSVPLGQFSRRAKRTAMKVRASSSWLDQDSQRFRLWKERASISPGMRKH